MHPFQCMVTVGHNTRVFVQNMKPAEREDTEKLRLEGNMGCYAWYWHRARSNPPAVCLWRLWSSTSTVTEIPPGLKYFFLMSYLWIYVSIQLCIMFMHSIVADDIIAEFNVYLQDCTSVYSKLILKTVLARCEDWDAAKLWIPTIIKMKVIYTEYLVRYRSCKIIFLPLTNFTVEWIYHTKLYIYLAALGTNLKKHIMTGYQLKSTLECGQ